MFVLVVKMGSLFSTVNAQWVLRQTIVASILTIVKGTSVVTAPPAMTW